MVDVPPYTIHNQLDASGLICPEPVMLLHKAVRETPAGGVIEVLATDPATERDIPKFCHFLGHELLYSVQSFGLYTYHIRKRGN